MLAFFLPVMQTHGCCYVDQPANISVFCVKQQFLFGKTATLYALSATIFVLGFIN